MKRRTRSILDMAVPVTGVVLVMGAVLVLWWSLALQLLVVAAGLLLVQGGIWRLTRPMVAEGRRFLALRAEVDEFIRQVRRLNEAAIRRGDDPAAETAFEAARLAMTDSVERMLEVAGVEDGARSTPAGSRGAHDRAG